MRKILFFLLLSGLLISCNSNTGKLFTTQRNFVYDALPSDTGLYEYTLKAFDEFELSIYTGNGEKCVDAFVGSQAQLAVPLKISVDYDGNCKFPLLGMLIVNGLSIRQLEKMLEEKYAFYYQKPFVKIKIINFKVTVFNGSEFNNGKVIIIPNQQMNIVEVIALAGGINDGKANKIKLIRGNLSHPKVFHLDLLSMESAKRCNIIVHPDDIIYIEPKNRIPDRTVSEVTAFLSVISAILLIYNIFK